MGVVGSIRGSPDCKRDYALRKNALPPCLMTSSVRCRNSMTNQVTKVRQKAENYKLCTAFLLKKT